MGKIRILTDEVASQVAAGEVVERPASLVKELVENSLDAGATRIGVDFSHGGTRFVSVRDDGCGMDREDALLCLERHATSKIRTGLDLAEVRTMGFRGEALPSIASVSRFRLVTREPSSEAGCEILVSGGKVEEVREVGAAPGTQIEVRDLFYNLPARRKFLRGEETEAAHILHGMEAVALANPSVAFESRRDGRVVQAWPQAKTLAVRIRDVFGADHLARMAEIEPFVGEGFQLSGFLAKPGQGRRDRLHQYVLLNGRPIVCPAVQQPLREAYADALPRGEHPLSVLVIEMDPDLVDCNVHPAKREVRLRQPDKLRRAIFDAARQAIVGRRPIVTIPEIVLPAPGAFAPIAPQRPLAFDPPPMARSRSVEVSVTPEMITPEAIAAPVEQALPYRLIGQLSKGYLILEGNEGLVLLDQRAARERILFEHLLRTMEKGPAPCQHLLAPIVCELPAREHSWAVEHLEDVRLAGFSIEPFGAMAMKIDGLPPGADGVEPGRLLHEVLSSLRAIGKLPPGKGIREALARSVSRIAAQIDRGREDIGLRLVRELLRCELPYATPEGRPTMIQFSFSELDRKFGRS
jgi:DNA mismatch repair protein MutL